MNDIETFGWGLIGPGRIAHKFADALRGVEGARLVAVQGRDAQRAQDFAARWGAASAGVDIDALLADPAVHGVYIATPHAFHGAAIARCLQAGKPVLCEKPLVTDAGMAREVMALSRERGVFLMEAVWTRYLPIYEQLARWLRDRVIGRVNGLQSSICFKAPYDERSRPFDPAQAGGALFDLGVYSLTMTRWVLTHAAGGKCPPLQGLQAHAAMAASGVDARLSAMLDFGDGLVSQFVCGLDGSADNSLRLHGELGSIEIQAPFWGASAAMLVRPGAETVYASAPHAVNGFEYEIAEAQACIRAGLLESTGMTHADTLATTEWMDRIRGQVGLRYPFDPAV
ncbi:MAG TPA: Gfo/Idh/MocA family oxidoreductase [Rubrivivax sp.]|nr:Gfo/Idh/MocA family oxidoreductase [Rubrivivax sp.]